MAAIVDDAISGRRGDTFREGAGGAPARLFFAPRRAGTADRVIAVVLAVATGTRFEIAYSASLSLALTALTAVLWLPTVIRSRRYLILAAIVAAAALSGALLTGFSSGLTSTADALSRTLVLLALPLGVAALMWCVAVTSVTTMTIAFGAGMMLSIVTLFAENGANWRFTFSVPVTILVLALVSASRRVWPQPAALVVLALIGVVNDSRSNSSMLLLAAALIVGQWVSRQHSVRARVLSAAATLLVAGVATYFLIQSAILEGYFGEVTQARTEAQLASSGSLILGGRPEIAASTALIARHPLGMGSGVSATYDDILAAKQGMWSIGYNPDNGYVNGYLFGGSVEVHSMFGDYWLWFGIAGVVLLAFLVWTVLSGFVQDFAGRSLTALFAYLTIRFLWDASFSPAVPAHLLPLTVVLAFVAAQYSARLRLAWSPAP